MGAKIQFSFSKAVMGLVLGGLSMSCNADSYEDGLMAYAVGDHALAASQFLVAAQSGNIGAEHMLARVYSEGSGVPRDDAEAMKWTKKAADGGIALAQYNLAEMYLDNGTADDAAAYQLYSKAAKGGVVMSYYRLGQMNEQGRGVKADAAEAKYFYGVAASELDVFAQKGDAHSQNTLAALYENGKGVAQNYARAVQWYRQAANQGLAEAQFNVGRMFVAGIGVDKNDLEAMGWFRRAAQQGYSKAQAALEQMTKDGHGSVAMVSSR